MSYLVNPSRRYELIINGEDYSEDFVSFAVSDSSVFRNGLILTSGTISLATVIGNAPIADYVNGGFRRGNIVTFATAEGAGSFQRHPRGYLYVLAASYAPETNITEIEVGCQITYDKLLNNFEDNYEQYAPFDLDPSTSTFEGLAAALASMGQYIYADNQGNIQTKDVFEVAGDWVSVRSSTALSVTPLAGAEPIPDKLNLSYQAPQDLSGDPVPTENTNESESYYYINYPGLEFIRVPDEDQSIEDELNSADIVSEGPLSVGSTGSCGLPPASNPDLEPDQGGEEVCTDKYTTASQTYYIPATRRDVQVSKYEGPAGQVSREVRTVTGPMIELNRGYFGDKYDYCRRVNGTECNPSGSCPTYGMLPNEMEITLEEVVTDYFYGEAGELIKTIQDSFVPLLAAVDTQDYRAGTYNPTEGDFSGFDSNMEQYATQMFRVRRIVTENNVEDDPNITAQRTTTFNSQLTRYRGIIRNGSLRTDLDALDGIETFVVDRTTTIAALDNSPERIVAEATATDTLVTEISVNSGAAGPGIYTRDESVPYPLLLSTQSAIESAANSYGRLLADLIEGDARGLTIGEALRSDVSSQWYPTCRFFFWDDLNNMALAMRMDATSWAVDTAGAAFVTGGLWMGPSSTNFTLPDNLVGNATPDMNDGTPGAPTNGPGDGSGGGGGLFPDPDQDDVDNFGDNGVILDINVFLTIENIVNFAGSTGVVPETPSVADSTILVEQTLSALVRGTITQPGALVDITGSGGLPTDFDGNLVVDQALVVTADLFA